MRNEFTITEYKDQLYVFGGWNPNGKTTVTHGGHTVSSHGCHGLWAFSLGYPPSILCDNY